jgi:ribosomal protein S18 acetylase RimI-like enzyme
MDSQSFSIEKVELVDKLLTDALQHLIRQLSSSAPPLTIEHVREIVASSGSVLLVAREKSHGAIIGALTLVTFRLPTGLRALIEDVVVDQAWRRQGVGKALSLVALRIATAKGARTVDLTSRPERTEANRLYCAIGFQKRETNVYRYSDRGERQS